MTETWLFIDSGYNTPSYNMALDEALLNWHSQGLIPPTIRFYGWKPAGLSIGYFQKTKDRIDLEAVKKYGYELVRRPTGGQAVLHDHELTYSVIVSEQHALMPKTVTEAYRVISKGLLEGFNLLNIQAELAIPEGKLDRNGSSVCFETPSWYELIIEGKKAAGSAQTRQKGVILQHGSIPLELDLDILYNLFIYPNERVKERAKRGFLNKAATINDVSDQTFTLDDIKVAFKTGFEKGLDITFKPYQLTAEQEAEVQTLAKEKYETDEWNLSR